MLNYHNHYPRLLIMVLLSFLAMFMLMYEMVNAFENVYPNLNQFFTWLASCTHPWR